MKTIYKYPLPVAAKCTLHMPKGARLLCVAEQNDVWCLWAEVDTAQPSTPRHIIVFGTGHPIPDELVKWYIGTIHMRGYVWHVFEELPKDHA
jgi:hypothetical protein